ncbi:MAG: MBL fold metallo-hydrolase [Bacteroidota bacterium]
MIHTIDLHFRGLRQNIAAFLAETEVGPVLVETGPHSTLPNLLKGIKVAGYQAEDIQHVFLTHIHLDHAGAAWWFAERGATIYVHPRGSKHLARPERLMASARQIYQDKMDELWGQMNPIAAERIVEVVHDTTQPGGLHAWYTPGHAVHHVAWQLEDDLFTGDVAGVRINGGVVIPPCPPPDIHLGHWQESLALLRSIAPQRLYLTHFGPIDYEEVHLTELHERLIRWADWIKPYAERGASVPELTPLYQKMVDDEFAALGISAEDRARYEAANPSWMSVAGLLRYWAKHGLSN